MLKEGYSMSATEGQEEFEEVQSDLKKKEDEVRDKRKKLPYFPPLFDEFVINFRWIRKLLNYWWTKRLEPEQF